MGQHSETRPRARLDTGSSARRALLARAFLAAVGVACSAPSASTMAVTPPPDSAPSSPAATRAPDNASAVLARPDLAAYHGWIKYLRFQAEHGASREAARGQLAEWSAKILDDPALLSKLRGVQEWAYESPADGSGQPFRISIPATYDGVRAMPLSLHLHGTGANHLEMADVPELLTGWSADERFIEVAVLGRGRGVGFIGLGEADVLQVLDYVSEHFRVDVDRVHLVGVSSGATGVLSLATRHPDRFASAWSVCGSALDVPIANILTVPLYVTHSDDDPGVPELMMRGAVERLPKLGGKAIWDLTTGFKHAVWKYHAGNARGRRWTFEQARPSSPAVRRIDFTALDGGASRAFWAEVEEWGPEARPARFMLRADGNQLEATLHNVLRLRLHLKQSPFDTTQPILLTLHDADAASASRQLSIAPSSGVDSVVIAVDPATGAATLEAASARQPVRRHTPGGANQLYDGEPLLIVYGTRGDAAGQAARRAAAELASHSANSGWFEASKRGAPSDGVPVNFNLYGALRVKADAEVTDEDMARHHLVLIGTAEQNSIVERMAPGLPVSFSSERIEFSDGFSVPSVGRTLRLVHFNPRASDRLIYWVASDEPEAYGANWPLIAYLTMGSHGIDALVTEDAKHTLVLGRSFDSRWRWQQRDRSPLLELDENTWAAADRLQADVARRALRADFAIASSYRTATGAAAFSPGWTRRSDVTPYFAQLSVLKLSGRELLATEAAFSKDRQQGNGDFIATVWPAPSSARVKPEQTYSVVATADGVYGLLSIAQLSPKEVALTDRTLADVVDAPERSSAPGR